MITKTLFALIATIGITNASAAVQSSQESSTPRLQVSTQSAHQLAREAGSQGRGRGRDDRRGHGQVDETNSESLMLAREASEAPRGRDNERAGDRQRRNRGGRG